MRHKPTEAEDILWQHVRNRQIAGLKFRRQHSIERFIVDFHCAEAELIIEVDGPIHQYQEQEDILRQEFIENQGLRVLRFSNDDVINHISLVLDQISGACRSPKQG